ncbi:T9SS type A sorting domain-containing protein [Gilvibacter sediminis]|uniref:T9SS type A sorting domain-containing protein n=1 Tax=Gilvibacter sediminis TaxID=379071 RepID=UPI0023504FB7|nr:T9SS type A sorting domain-containing protein [Gilvibacter sediminis]MDC7997065.1 T9SS type A sorting domain-containing protein [Gilvibacter sediminis]
MKKTSSFFFCLFVVFHGLGQFSENLLTDQIEDPRIVRIADANQDGTNDIFIGAIPGQVYFTYGIGEGGTYADPSLLFSYPPCCTAPFDIELNDLDADGDLDVLVSYADDGTFGLFRLYMQEGDSGIYEAGSNLGNWEEGNFVLFDFNGDGLKDFGRGSIWNTDLRVRLNQGDGSFSSFVTLADNSFNGFKYDFLDFDLDGDTDILTIGAGRLASIQQPEVWDEIWPTTVLFTDLGNFGDFEILDVDEDGDKDLVIANKTAGALQWAENTDGLFTLSPLMTIQDGMTGLSEVELGDVDADGLPDILISLFSESKLSWFKNIDGSSEFGSEVVISDSEDGIGRLVVGDLDNDGDSDILTYSSTTDLVKYWINETILSTPEFENSLAIYPNPSSELLTINSKQEFKQYRIYSILGQLVRGDSFSEQIDISQLRKGIYFLELTTSMGQKHIGRFIKL